MGHVMPEAWGVGITLEPSGAGHTFERVGHVDGTALQSNGALPSRAWWHGTEIAFEPGSEHPKSVISLQDPSGIALEISRTLTRRFLELRPRPLAQKTLQTTFI